MALKYDIKKLRIIVRGRERNEANEMSCHKTN